MFSKLREVGGKLKERSQSIRSLTGSDSGASHGSGFLCPECKGSFPESEMLQSHWLVCLSQSDTFVPSEDTLDIESMEVEEIKDLLRETRKESAKLFRYNQDIVRKSGAMSMEVGGLQKQIDDESHKSANLQEMNLALQETYLSQVRRNEELRQLLEQRSMTSPDDVHVLTRELSSLHATLSEKEQEWEKGQHADSRQTEYRHKIEEAERTLTEVQLELKVREQQTSLLNNQVREMEEANKQLSEELATQKAETNKLLIEKECNQSNAQISDQLERCLTAVSADKQELFEKIGTDALSGALSTTMVQQVQTDLSESRLLLRQEKESAEKREQQLIGRYTSELKERENQLSDVRNKNETLREGSEQLRLEVLECKQRQRELTNQLETLRREQTETNSQLTLTNQKLAEEEARLTGMTEGNQLIGKHLTQEQSKTSDLELELDTARTDFIELNRLIDEKEAELERALSRAVKSEEDLNNTLELKKSLSNQILEMDCSTQDLKSQLESEKSSSLEQRREVGELTELTNQMTEQLEAGRDEIKKRSEEHESVKSLLIEQKLELQNKISLAEDKCRSLESQLTSEKRDKENRLANLQKELQQTQERGEKLDSQSNSLKEQLEKEKTLSQLTRTNLQQDISSLRDDVRAGDAERRRLQEQLDSQFGRMAVLDAKLQNLRDENQSLIGTQMEREENIINYKEKINRLEVELGDTKSALYEMAQENQKQTLKEAKMADRKWEDDTKVILCNECHKKFSVTVRKHHCRRCGQIYCQECTQSQADLPGYKGKVRVCGACYNELSS